MLELTETFWTNLPLAPLGLARTIASTNARKFSLRSSSPKLALPMPAWMMPASRPELDLAALGVGDRLGDVHRDGAELRVRHQPLGTEHLAEPTDDAHHVRRRNHAVEVDLAALDALHQVLGTDDVGPAAVASSALPPLANTATRPSCRCPWAG
jgi:hypothetical protein